MRLQTVLVVLCAAVIVLAATSTFSAVVSAENHAAYCHRTDKIIDAFQSVIVYATTPQPGDKPLTPKQVKRVTSFQAHSAALLNSARC